MSSARVPALEGKWRAAALYILLTLLLAYPISIRPDRIAWANDPDEHLVMWLLAWDTHAFLHQPLSIFDANTFYPLHRTLAYQENLIGDAFFAAPVLWLTSNPVLAANFVSLLACVLCGLGAYVLGRRVGLREGGALLCGVVFAFSPPRFLRFPQTHLAVVQWIPFALASLHQYFEHGRRRDLLLATGFFTLEVMSSGHGGVFAVVAIALMLAYRFALGEPILIVRRLRDFGIAGALLIVPDVLFLIPYRLNQVQMGLRRSLGSWDTSIESFFASPTRVDRFLQSLVTSHDINGAASAWLFPGVVPLALGFAAIAAGAIPVLRRRSDRSAGAARFAGVSRPPDRWGRYRSPILCMLAAGVAWGGISVMRPLLPAGDGLAANYYAGAHWSGAAILSTVDPVPSSAEMLAHANVDAAGPFSASWTGYLSVGAPGLYFFATDSGDQSRVSIDNQLVVDNTGGHPNAQAGSVRLSQGPHRIAIEYVRLAGPPALKWMWQRSTDPYYTPVPAWALSRRPATPRVALAARAVDTARPIAVLGVTLALAWALVLWLALRHDAWAYAFAAVRRNPTPFYLLLTALCIGLSLGPPYGLWRFVYWMPGFDFIRGSSRFMVLGLLGIAVLAGVGFDRLSARLGPRGRLAAGTVVCALMAAEFAAQPFSVPYRLEIPSADRWVARQPKPFVVAEVPASNYARYQTMYMLYSMSHWQKTVHGYGGIEPELSSILYRELETFPDVPSLQHLQQLDVTYVVVHIDMYSPEQWPAVDQRLRSFGDWLNLAYSDPTGRVYAIRRPQETTRAF
jgi:hypothetical protein